MHIGAHLPLLFARTAR